MRSLLSALGSLLLLACSVEVASLGSTSPAAEPAHPDDHRPLGSDEPSASIPIDVEDAGSEPPPPALSGPSATAPMGAAPSAPSAMPTASKPAAPALVDAGVAPATPPDAAVVPVKPRAPEFVLTSPAFSSGAVIPVANTCNGADVSPAFAWRGVPPGTKSLAMVLTTRTSIFGRVSGFTRWTLWNIPATFDGLPAMLDEGHHPSDVPGATQISNESESSSQASGSSGPGGAFGAGASGPGGGSLGGGSLGGAGGSTGGSSGTDAHVGRRYRGPCSYGFPQTFEFALYALGESTSAAPEWSFTLTTDDVVSWLETKANVLGRTSLGGVSP